MFERILVAVDGSDFSRRAAKYGLELAAQLDAAVDVLHALEPARFEGDADPESAGREMLATVTAMDIDGDPDVETHLVEGKPHERIAAHVSEYGADLVVMGRRGRNGIEEHLLGSVPERVLRTVEVPVLTVPGIIIDTETGRSYDDILLTTDGSEIAERAGPYGAGLARRLGAALHLFTAVDVRTEAGVFNAGGVSEAYVERLKDEGREALDSLADGLDLSGVDTRQTVGEGRVCEALDNYATEQDIDLVVLASKGETNLAGQHLGSTARRVLQYVQQPVLVVPVVE